MTIPINNDDKMVPRYLRPHAESSNRSANVIGYETCFSGNPTPSSISGSQLPPAGHRQVTSM
ncbi:hypothetical protein J14TS5_20010 [Paenibacillus lautus]|nr:hypothetical protein J14TS5_20010 [Paenibacillus lautus]